MLALLALIQPIRINRTTVFAHPLIKAFSTLFGLPAGVVTPSARGFKHLAQDRVRHGPLSKIPQAAEGAWLWASLDHQHIRTAACVPYRSARL